MIFSTTVIVFCLASSAFSSPLPDTSSGAKSTSDKSTSKTDGSSSGGMDWSIFLPKLVNDSLPANEFKKADTDSSSNSTKSSDSPAGGIKSFIPDFSKFNKKPGDGEKKDNSTVESGADGSSKVPDFSKYSDKPAGVGGSSDEPAASDSSPHSSPASSSSVPDDSKNTDGNPSGTESKNDSPSNSPSSPEDNDGPAAVESSKSLAPASENSDETLPSAADKATEPLNLPSGSTNVSDGPVSDSQDDDSMVQESADLTDGPETKPGSASDTEGALRLQASKRPGKGNISKPSSATTTVIPTESSTNDLTGETTSQPNDLESTLTSTSQSVAEESESTDSSGPQNKSDATVETFEEKLTTTDYSPAKMSNDIPSTTEGSIDEQQQTAYTSELVTESPHNEMTTTVTSEPADSETTPSEAISSTSKESDSTVLSTEADLLTTKSTTEPETTTANEITSTTEDSSMITTTELDGSSTTTEISIDETTTADAKETEFDLTTQINESKKDPPTTERIEFTTTASPEPEPEPEPETVATTRSADNPTTQENHSTQIAGLDDNKTGAEKNDICPKHPEGEDPGLYPDPLDCKKFYHCANRIAYHMKCPPTTVFNPSLKVCDSPEHLMEGECKA